MNQYLGARIKLITYVSFVSIVDLLQLNHSQWSYISIFSFLNKFIVLKYKMCLKITSNPIQTINYSKPNLTLALFKDCN